MNSSCLGPIDCDERSVEGLGWIAASPAPRGGDLLAQAVVVANTPWKRVRLDPRGGDECGEACDEVKGLEHDVGGAIAIGSFEAVAHVALVSLNFESIRESTCCFSE